jgi:hypothetical protein
VKVRGETGEAELRAGSPRAKADPATYAEHFPECRDRVFAVALFAQQPAEEDVRSRPAYSELLKEIEALLQM